MFGAKSWFLLAPILILFPHSHALIRSEAGADAGHLSAQARGGDSGGTLREHVTGRSGHQKGTLRTSVPSIDLDDVLPSKASDRDFSI